MLNNQVSFKVGNNQNVLVAIDSRGEWPSVVDGHHFEWLEYIYCYECKLNSNSIVIYASALDLGDRGLSQGTDIFKSYPIDFSEQIEILTREKFLAEKKADFYCCQSEIANSPAQVTSTPLGPSAVVPKVPEFHGSIVGFPRWISWVSDLFDNYSQLTDFSKRLMVTDSLKGEARSWFDAEPDSSTISWAAMKDALLRQYGGTNSISNALNTISALKLTSRSDFNSFIQRIRPAIQLVTKSDDTLARIRPAIQLVTKSDDTLAVAMLRQQIDSDIRRYLPEIQNETFTAFELRLRLQFQELQSKSGTTSVVHYPTSSTAMNLDTISAPIRRFNSSMVSSLETLNRTHPATLLCCQHSLNNTSRTASVLPAERKAT
ncbi:hypothetical protein BB561_006918 [Smittium simulii]|uniref:Retrotransposon gag domain-containing protein n=1 Tax=Smittium simulii TaxID=133385 RepID=A0A2T9Y002_9FUNG|nr:hypothetical protein BB561_006918 [Smittium simulii]